MDPGKFDSFLDYRSSSRIVKDLPFGQRKIQSSKGKLIETPNIIKCMAPQGIIDQYKVYCTKRAIEPLGV